MSSSFVVHFLSLLFIRTWHSVQLPAVPSDAHESWGETSPGNVTFNPKYYRSKWKGLFFIQASLCHDVITKQSTRKVMAWRSRVHAPILDRFPKTPGIQKLLSITEVAIRIMMKDETSRFVSVCSASPRSLDPSASPLMWNFSFLTLFKIQGGFQTTCRRSNSASRPGVPHARGHRFERLS